MLAALTQFFFPVDVTSKRRLLALEQRLAATEKALFIERMQAISSSNSAESASGSDVRRGALSPVSVALDDLLVGYTEGTIRALPAWKMAIAGSTSLPPQPAALDENRDLHPFVSPFFTAAVSAVKGLKLWGNVITSDDIDKAEIKPDFTVTHIREALPSLLAALVLVEVKKPRSMNLAIGQACVYLRRLVYKIFREANDRGEEAFLSQIHAWGVATDGCSICFLRLSSGAPEVGGSYLSATPCPVQVSPELKFLDWGWEESRQGRPSPNHPISEGFAALVRLLSAVAATPFPWRQPLIRLSTVVREFIAEDLEVVVPEAATASMGSSAAALEAILQEGQRSQPLPLHITPHKRLGCGGSSDAYECSAGACAVGARKEEEEEEREREGGGGGEGGARFVLKVPRACTKDVLECYKRECTALRALKLAGARGLVPVLLGRGTRALAASAYVPELEVGPLDWPLLLLYPVGRSLEAWMEEAVANEKLGGGGGGAVSASVARMRCATVVALRVAEALRAAHEAGYIHCDLRPSNLAVGSGSGSGGVFVLDWGLARPLGESALGVGVGAFSSELAFDVATRSYPACPALDALALLYTWLSLAFNSTGSAPWGRECSFIAKMHARRKDWVASKRTTHGAVEAVAAAIDAISGEEVKPTLDAMGIVQGALVKMQGALGMVVDG